MNSNLKGYVVGVKDIFLGKSSSPLKIREHGDTLIEVMFATAAGALVIIIALTLMNRGLAQIQVAVESTFVRQAIDGEAEALRYLRGQYLKDPTANTDDVRLWREIISSTYKKTQASSFGTCTITPATKAFAIKDSTSAPGSNNNPYDDGVGVQSLALNNAPSADSPTYAQVGRGIWIEAVEGPVIAGEAKYTDLHVRACWDPPFSSTQKATIGTIVRLYYDDVSVTNPIPACPSGTTGTPPSCTPVATLPTCPVGQIGTPPACVTPPLPGPGGTPCATSATLVFCDDFEKYNKAVVKDGTLAGTPFSPDWQNNQACANRVYVVDDPARSGGKSLRMTVQPGDHGTVTIVNGKRVITKNPACPASPNENPRAQFLSKALFRDEDDYFIRVGTYFPADFPRTVALPPVQGGHNSYLQVMEIFGSPTTCSPTIGIFLVGDHYVFNQQREAKVNNVCQPVVSGVWNSIKNGNSQKVQFGTGWDQIVMHVKFSTNPSRGFIEIWLNGQQQKFSDGSTKYKMPTLLPGVSYNPGGTNQLYVNQYRGAAAWPEGPLTLYHDDVKVGRTYASVQ